MVCVITYSGGYSKTKKNYYFDDGVLPQKEEIQLQTEIIKPHTLEGKKK